MLTLLSTQTYKQAFQINKHPKGKKLWGYVAIAFNKVDGDRLTQVGPDRLCAEWLIKNGATIQLKELPDRVLKDYNLLPPESHLFHIKVVDASGSSIMKIGFDHFIGCKDIDTVTIHDCEHLEFDGLEGLIYLKNSLLRLQVSSCYNMNNNSLGVIKSLTNLQQLKMFDLKFVTNFERIVEEIKTSLPNCAVKTTRN